jgi:hypothetical protein
MPRIPGQPIHGANHRICGILQDDGALVRHIEPNGILRSFGALATDVQGLQAAEKRGATRVRVVVSDGRCFEASIQDHWDHGWTLDLGWGPQRALKLNAWRLTRREGVTA